MESPADILPHLQRLERLDAQHLHLPIYPPGASLPLIQTLRWLTLKSVSVQWMAGRVFPALESCSITFPHHSDTIHVQPVTMFLWEREGMRHAPSRLSTDVPVTMFACTELAYDSNDLDPLRHFHHSPPTRLQVRSGQWNVRRGNPQFVVICPTVFTSTQCLYFLDIGVQCSEQLLVLALRQLPALEELCLRLASPYALSETFFQEFVTTRSNAGSPCEMAALPRLPLCAKLTELLLHYRRWLRGPERKGLIPVFNDIVSSCYSEGGCNLYLSVDEPIQYWEVQGLVESTCDIADDGNSYVLGIPSPYGIIPLQWIEPRSLLEVPFKEAEYLVARDQLSIGCLSTLHNLVELRVGDKQDILLYGYKRRVPDPGTERAGYGTW